VQAAPSFCVPDDWGDNTPPETGAATADPQGNGGDAAPPAGGLSGMFKRIEGLGYAESPTESVR
jgi:hypothetical protein